MPPIASLLKAVSAALSLAALTSSSPIVSHADYGYWDVELTRASSASGRKWRNIVANYTGPAAPAESADCYWINFREPDSGEITECDEGFTVGYNGYYPSKATITVQQVLKAADGTIITLNGTSLEFDERCGLGGDGRTCKGSTRIEAGLVSS